MNRINEQAFAPFLIACTCGVSILSGRIVGDIEDCRVGIVCNGRCSNNMESGAIVDYHCHKFQYVDQHEHAIVVAGFE